MATEFNPDWELQPSDVLAVALTLALNKHIPNWRGAEDDQLEKVARELIESCSAQWMRDVLRSRRASLEWGELRSAYNAAADRLDVLHSKLVI